MKIKIEGKITDILDDERNKEKFIVKVELEDELGDIILYNVRMRDRYELKLNDVIDIEVNTFNRYMIISDEHIISTKHKCIVYFNDIIFECCVETPTYILSRCK